jgi:hypothetical protein
MSGEGPATLRPKLLTVANRPYRVSRSGNTVWRFSTSPGSLLANSAFSGRKLLPVNAIDTQSRLNVRPERSKDLTLLGYADALCRELGEAKDRNDGEDERQSPDEARTEDCSSCGKAHIE